LSEPRGFQNPRAGDYPCPGVVLAAHPSPDTNDLVCKSICVSVCYHFGYAPGSPGMIGQPGQSGCSATYRKAIMAFEVA